MLGYPGGFFVAAMEEDAMTQHELAASRNTDVAGVGLILEFLEILLTKRISGEQAVFAHMPPGRMRRISRMVEDCDADDPSVRQGPGIIAPWGTLSPCRAISVAVRIEDAARSGAPLTALPVHYADRLVHPNGEHTLLRVAKHEGAL